MTSFNRDGDPHARRLRSGRLSAPFQTYFVTKCTHGHRNILAEPIAAETVIRSLEYVRRAGHIKLLAFVIMPDHYHTVFTLLEGEDLSGIMRRVGSFTANRIRRILQLDHAVWQGEGFYDRACRNDAEVYEIVEYIHHNPVRRGLATSPEEWVFSSATRHGKTSWIGIGGFEDRRTPTRSPDGAGSYCFAWRSLPTLRRTEPAPTPATGGPSQPFAGRSRLLLLRLAVPPNLSPDGAGSYSCDWRSLPTLRRTEPAPTPATGGPSQPFAGRSRLLLLRLAVPPNLSPDGAGSYSCDWRSLPTFRRTEPAPTPATGGPSQPFAGRSRLLLLRLAAFSAAILTPPEAPRAWPGRAVGRARSRRRCRTGCYRRCRIRR